MKLNLTFRQALELTLALGGLVWITWLAGPALNPKPGAGNLHIYALEAMVLSMAVVGGAAVAVPPRQTPPSDALVLSRDGSRVGGACSDVL